MNRLPSDQDGFPTIFIGRASCALTSCELIQAFDTIHDVEAIPFHTSNVPWPRVALFRRFFLARNGRQQKLRRVCVHGVRALNVSTQGCVRSMILELCQCQSHSFGPVGFNQWKWFFNARNY